jgi:hypothetical protein
MADKTITSIFIVPTLKIPKDQLLENGFINGYIQDVEQDMQYNNSVYLLFNPKDLIKFRDFLDDEYERTEQIIEDYDYDGGFVVVVYKLDEQYKQEYELVKLGKYSETSEDFQKLFPKVVKLKKNGLHRDELSLQHRVFNKTEDLIEYWEKKLGIDWNSDLEAWEGWNKEKEILNINKLKINESTGSIK